MAPNIVGFRRVFDGGCVWCQEASMYLYSTDDLMPMHEFCNCGVAPVFEGENYGLLEGSGPEGSMPDVELGRRLDQSRPLLSPDSLLAGLGDRESVAGEFRDWTDKLDFDAQESISEYMDDSMSVNAFLRGKTVGQPEKQADIAMLLDRAMKPLERDTLVYRGIARPFEEVFGQPPEVGGLIKDQAFMSTTLRKSVAREFTGARGLGTFIEIILPRGTRTSWLDDDKGEAELLVARGQSLEIIKVLEGGSRLVVRLVV